MDESTVYTTLSAFIDVLFGIDMAISFRTTFISVEGENVDDSWQMAKNYMTGMFAFDLLATIPL